MGGTFNPIHYGHLKTAAKTADLFNLKEVWFIPVSRPPHKKARDIALAEHRLQMVEIGMNHDPRFKLNSAELERQGTSYTVDTLRQLREACCPGGHFFFIMGIDSFWDIPTWKEAPEVFSLTNFVVSARAGYSLGKINDIFRHTVFKGLNFIETSEGKDYGCRSFRAADSRFSIYFLETDPIPVSSTAIREKIRKGEKFSGYLPETVEKYIIEKGIYRN